MSNVYHVVVERIEPLSRYYDMFVEADSQEEAKDRAAAIEATRKFRGASKISTPKKNPSKRVVTSAAYPYHASEITVAQLVKSINAGDKQYRGETVPDLYVQVGVELKPKEKPA